MKEKDRLDPKTNLRIPGGNPYRKRNFSTSHPYLQPGFIFPCCNKPKEHEKSNIRNTKSIH